MFVLSKGDANGSNSPYFHTGSFYLNVVGIHTWLVGSKKIVKGEVI